MDLQEELASRIRGKVVVLGIGNPSRGDDAAGSLLAQQLKNESNLFVIDAQDVPENYLWRLADERPDTIVMVDSVNLNAAPGSVAVLEKESLAGYWPSTHRMPVSLLIDYLEKETHARVFLIAIQPSQTGFMQPVQEDVQASIASVADALKSVLKMRCHSLAVAPFVDAKEVAS
jgi:hydrogenase 3 maturation protease